MSRKQSGFTLIELMIVIAIIAIIAAIAIPNLLAARLAANETAAIATLRNIVSSQAQFQQSGKLDLDNGGVGDGTGEYGGFLELAGAANGVGPNGASRLAVGLTPPVLSSAFQNSTQRRGHAFRLRLHDVPARRHGEAGDEPSPSASVDPDLAETTWCCYAWPVNYNQSGNRTFFVNQAGDVLGCEDSNYDGPGNGPAADAAFQTAERDDRCDRDRHRGSATATTNATWRQVN